MVRDGFGGDDVLFFAANVYYQIAIVSLVTL